MDSMESQKSESLSQIEKTEEKSANDMNEANTEQDDNNSLVLMQPLKEGVEWKSEKGSHTSTIIEALDLSDLDKIFSRKRKSSERKQIDSGCDDLEGSQYDKIYKDAKHLKEQKDTLVRMQCLKDISIPDGLAKKFGEMERSIENMVMEVELLTRTLFEDPLQPQFRSNPGRRRKPTEIRPQRASGDSGIGSSNYGSSVSSGGSAFTSRTGSRLPLQSGLDSITEDEKTKRYIDTTNFDRSLSDPSSEQNDLSRTAGENTESSESDNEKQPGYSSDESRVSSISSIEKSDQLTQPNLLPLIETRDQLTQTILLPLIEKRDQLSQTNLLSFNVQAPKSVEVQETFFKFPMTVESELIQGAVGSPNGNNVKLDISDSQSDL